MTMPLPRGNERGSQADFLADLFAGQRRAAAKRAGQLAASGAWIAELERSQAFFRAEEEWAQDRREAAADQRLEDAEDAAFPVHVTAGRAAALLRANRIHPISYPGPEQTKPFTTQQLNEKSPRGEALRANPRRNGIRAPEFEPIAAYSLVPSLSGTEVHGGGRRRRDREQIGPDPSTYRYTGALLFDPEGELYLVKRGVMPGNAQLLTDTQIAAGPPRELVAPPFASTGVTVMEQWQTLFAATLRAQGVTHA